MIYTFYSYKGGVGRSMALANVAVWLYYRGARVLVVDADLEAPGIEQFFFRDPADVAQAQAAPGFLDLLLTYQRLFKRTSARAEMQPDELFAAARSGMPPLDDYLVTVAGTPAAAGAPSASPSLRLMGGGRRDSNAFAHFANAVQDFDWSEFYRAYQGEVFFEWLRRSVTDMSDVVLIDSRTGVTEMGGVCTRQLADVVVAFSAANRQNFAGTLMMVESFRRPEILRARDGKPDAVIVPSRVESAELDNREKFKGLIQRSERDEGTEGVGEDLRPAAFRSLRRSFWDLHIPYVPRFSFDEALSFDVLPGSNVIRADELETAYRRLAAHLVLLAPPDSALRMCCAEDLQQFVPSPAAASTRDTLWRSVFIAHARPDGERLAAVMRERVAKSASEIVVLEPPAGARRLPDSVESIIFVLTAGALMDQALLRELRQARRDGTRIWPVAHPGDSRQVVNNLPRWLRKQHIFDIDAERDSLIQQLRLPYERRRVPFMAPQLRPTYVPRVALEDSIRTRLFSATPERRTVALVGLGGSGKTAMAVALAHDERVQDEFADGILWAWLDSTDVVASLNAMYAEMTGETVTFPSSELAALNLARVLDRKRCLIVMDGIKEPQDLEPFTRGGAECVRMVLTRNREAARGADVVEVAAMTVEEAKQLLSKTGYVGPEIADIAAGLARWPLALDLARTILLQRGDSGESISEAARWFLDRVQTEGFDTLGDGYLEVNTGLSQLDDVSRKRLLKLGEFGRIEVTLDEARRAWQVDASEVERLVRTFEKTSLAKLDLRRMTVHLPSLFWEDPFKPSSARGRLPSPGNAPAKVAQKKAAKAK
jgi:MinD-like ATPase involved in chromosome partitioning or flagellar assembly